MQAHILKELERIINDLGFTVVPDVLRNSNGSGRMFVMKSFELVFSYAYHFTPFGYTFQFMEQNGVFEQEEIQLEYNTVRNELPDAVNDMVKKWQTVKSRNIQ